MIKVLFVCTGNICRSPTAEGIFRSLVENDGKAEDITVDSAGVSGWHEGQCPDMRAIQTAQDNGLDISGLCARRVIRDDFKDFDLIIALDRSHLEALKEMRPQFSPAHEKAELRLMMDFAPQFKTKDVPDPYYGGAKGFQNVFEMIYAACENLLIEIKGRYNL